MSDLLRAEVTTLLGTIAELERRVGELERSRGLIGNIPRGGSIGVVDPADGSGLVVLGTLVDGTSLGAEFYDSTGDIVARFGDLDSGAHKGVEVFNANGIRILRADERGSLEPNVHVPFAAFQDISVNSGTFTSTHHGYVEKMKNPYLHLRVPIDCDSGTTAELRVSIVRTGSPGGTQVTAVKSIPSAASTSYHLYVQVDMVLDARAEFIVETRRVSGAGAVRTATPFGDWGDYTATATTVGVWT